MFKNYHIVIFKDREGGFRNLRLRGWLSFLLFLLLAGMGGLNAYLWKFYTHSLTLERELEETQRLNRTGESQLLSLAGKLQALEEDVGRVQRFDAKLRVLLNVDTDLSGQESDSYPAGSSGVTGLLNDAGYLARHRDLYARRLHSLLDELSSNILLEEVEQQTLVSIMRTGKDSLQSTPSIWPAKGFLSSGFGWRRSPFSGARTMHTGLDIANRVGTPVSAPARGSITFSGNDGAYGICITIDHGNGVVTRYAHLSKSLVKAGDYIQRGEVVGAIGNTGRSTGPHLHYEVLLNGMHVNPMRYILN